MDTNTSCNSTLIQECVLMINKLGWGLGLKVNLMLTEEYCPCKEDPESMEKECIHSKTTSG